MIAPYADKAIPLSLKSLTGLRYRTLNCMECGQPFLERNKDQIFRIGTNDMPGEVHIDPSGVIVGVCGNCTQKYTVTIALTVEQDREGIPLYMQPQSLYLTSEPTKKLRDIFCLECGKAYYSISDRIQQMVDNIVPPEYLDVSRLGPMEARCKYQHCRQRWYVRV